MSNESVPMGVSLDVDESLVLKNLILMDKENDEFTKLLNTVDNPERPSVVIRPMPGACVKIKDENNDKLFLNICTTTEIPPPADISNEELLKIMEEEEPSYRIPMSIGQERLETDKCGVPRLTYDIAVNTAFFEKCTNNRMFWTFMITVVIQGVSHKFHKSINPKEFILLKNRKVIGTLQDHRIEKREVKGATENAVQKPLIEELPLKLNSTAQTDSLPEIIDGRLLSDEELKNVEKPEYVIFKLPDKGKSEQLVGIFRLIGVSSKDISLNVGEDRIVVSCLKIGYLIDVLVPYTIQQDKIVAKYDPYLSILQVNLPVV